MTDGVMFTDHRITSEARKAVRATVKGHRDLDTSLQETIGANK